MIAAGVNAKGSSDLHGYASITITLDRYGRLMSGFGGGGPLVYSTPISRPNRKGQPLERLAERVEVEQFEAGATIFKQGERSQGRVLVVRRGAIELVDGSRVLDVLGEGELFGHPSMLSGLPFGFEARAQEESRCYSMAASDVIPLL